MPATIVEHVVKVRKICSGKKNQLVLYDVHGKKTVNDMWWEKAFLIIFNLDWQLV